jgi:flagellar biogenesis protein FliO
MKKNLVIEVDNFEQGEDGLELKTLTGKPDKVIIKVRDAKIVVSMTELKEAISQLQEFENQSDHSQDFEELNWNGGSF